MQAALRRYRIPPHATFRPPPSPPPPPSRRPSPSFRSLLFSFSFFSFLLFFLPAPPPPPAGTCASSPLPRRGTLRREGVPPPSAAFVRSGAASEPGGGGVPSSSPTRDKVLGQRRLSLPPPSPRPPTVSPEPRAVGHGGGSRAEPRRGGAALLSGRVGPRAARCCNRVFFFGEQRGGRAVD